MFRRIVTNYGLSNKINFIRPPIIYYNITRPHHSACKPDRYVIYNL